MVYTKEHIFELGREKFVADIVSDILKKDGLDENEIKEVILDDHGNCIHVTFTGAASTSAIIAIGEAFADNNGPNVHAVGDNTLNIVFVNEKYDCLIDNEETGY